MPGGHGGGMASTNNSIMVNSARHDAPASRPPPVWRVFVGGCMGSVIGCSMCHPFDVVKIRLQCQGEGLRQAAGRGNLGIIGTSRHILKHEGLLGFSYGISSQILRATSYYAIKIALYDVIKQEVFNELPGKPISLHKKIAVSHETHMRAFMWPSCLEGVIPLMSSDVPFPCGVAGIVVHDENPDACMCELIMSSHLGAGGAFFRGDRSSSHQSLRPNHGANAHRPDKAQGHEAELWKRFWRALQAAQG